MTSEKNFGEHRVTSKDGLNLYYRTYAHHNIRQIPILCLHGLTRNSKDFHDVALHLHPEWRVLSADVRGRGQSDYDPEWNNYHPDTYVEDAWVLLDSLSIDQVIIMGTSMGGLMAMIMAAQQPDRIAGVILNDIGPELSAEGLKRIMSYVGDVKPDYSYEEVLQRVRKLNQIFFPELDDAGWHKFLERGYRQVDGGRYVVDYDANIIKALLEGASAPDDLWQLFNKLSEIPTLVLRGELSDLLSTETVAKMQQVKPDLQYCCVKNRGHTPMLNEPDSIMAIENYLREFSKT